MYFLGQQNIRDTRIIVFLRVDMEAVRNPHITAAIAVMDLLMDQLMVLIRPPEI